MYSLNKNTKIQQILEKQHLNWQRQGKEHQKIFARKQIIQCQDDQCIQFRQPTAITNAKQKAKSIMKFKYNEQVKPDIQQLNLQDPIHFYTPSSHNKKSLLLKQQMTKKKNFINLQESPYQDNEEITSLYQKTALCFFDEVCDDDIIRGQKQSEIIMAINAKEVVDIVKQFQIEYEQK